MLGQKPLVESAGAAAAAPVGGHIPRQLVEHMQRLQLTLSSVEELCSCIGLSQLLPAWQADASGSSVG
jgi:hypothetical protein